MFSRHPNGYIHLKRERNNKKREIKRHERCWMGGNTIEGVHVSLPKSILYNLCVYEFPIRMQAKEEFLNIKLLYMYLHVSTVI